MTLTKPLAHLATAPLVFGGNVFGWTADRERSFALLDHFVGAGFGTIDTADAYSVWIPGHKGGESETIIGEWQKARGNRDSLTLITKVGMELAPDKKGLSPDYIARAVEDSLRRLQTDRIDLYLSHYPDPSVPVAETLGAYARLIEAGKVRAIGCSNHTPDQIRAALKAADDHGLPRYAVTQPQYNLYDRAGFEAGERDLALAEGLEVISYYALAAGFLTGKYRSDADLGKSPRGYGMGVYMNPRGMHILAALDQVAEAHGAKPAEIAIAWVIRQAGITAPIASATSIEQLDSLIRATRLDLTTEDLALLDQASA